MTAAASGASPQDRQPRCVALIVDDEPRIRAAAVELFEDLGARVFDAYNAAQAIAILRQNPEIELLFVDVRLPGIGGVELASMAVTMRPSLRVVLTSGYGPPKASHRWPFVPKPWNRTSIHVAITEALGPSGA